MRLLPRRRNRTRGRHARAACPPRTRRLPAVDAEALDLAGMETMQVFLCQLCRRPTTAADVETTSNGQVVARQHRPGQCPKRGVR